jgi:hypothetical protein
MAEEDEEMMSAGVAELVFDPRWRVFGIKMHAAADTVVVLRVRHPRHGIIDFFLPPESAGVMPQAFRNLLDAIKKEGEGSPDELPPGVRIQ